MVANYTAWICPGVQLEDLHVSIFYNEVTDHGNQLGEATRNACIRGQKLATDSKIARPILEASSMILNRLRTKFRV